MDFRQNLLLIFFYNLKRNEYGHESLKFLINTEIVNKWPGNKGKKYFGFLNYFSH